jgi:hypothetical protein
MPLTPAQAEALLNKHNPHVVILPRPDAANPNLSRPYRLHMDAHGGTTTRIELSWHWASS